jgi:hypothetical protein
LTYAQAGERLGLSPEAARHRARRAGWRTMPGNDGRTLILVPNDVEPVRTPVRASVHTPAQAEDGAATDRAHDRAERAFITSLEALRTAHAGEVARLNARIDALLHAGEGHRAEIVAIEAKLTAATARAEEAEQVRDAARKRAHELANRMMRLEAEAEEGRETKERLTGLDRLLADAEHRLTEAEQGRRTAQERLDAQYRAEVERRGKGRWARLRAAWRGE